LQVDLKNTTAEDVDALKTLSLDFFRLPGGDIILSEGQSWSSI